MYVEKLYDFVPFTQIMHYYGKVNNSVLYLSTQNLTCLNKARIVARSYSFDLFQLFKMEVLNLL